MAVTDRSYVCLIYERKWFYHLLSLCLLTLLAAGMPLTADAAVDDCSTGNHNYSVITHSATEEEEGVLIYTCSLCGYEYIEVIPATGHDWSEWFTDIEASCTEEGHQYRICSRYTDAVHTEEQAIPAPGHDYEETVSPAVCEKSGVKVYTCKRCGDSYEEAFGEALGHEYVTEIAEKPDCDTEGVRTYICRRCGDSYTEAIAAIGHDYGEWIIDRRPTKHVSGHRYRTCENNSTHMQEEYLDRLPAVPAPVPVDTSSDMNAMDMVFGAVGAGGVTTFGFFIFNDYRIILYDYKKRKLRLREKKERGK